MTVMSFHETGSWATAGTSVTGGKAKDGSVARPRAAAGRAKARGVDSLVIRWKL